jgi:hypothetical protein
MDEMTLLRDLRLSIPAADVTRAAEEAFISRITAEAANPPAATHPDTAARIAAPQRRLHSFVPGRGWPRPAVRDFAWRLGVIGGRHRWRLAVAVVVSVALAVGLIAGVRHSAGSSGPAGGPVPAVLLAAKAAAMAAAQPSVPPGQWVYTKTATETITPAGIRYACAVKNGQGQVHDVAIPTFGGRISIPPGTPCSVSSNGMVSTGNYRSVTPLPGGKHIAVTGKGTVVATSYPAATVRQEKEQWSTADGTRNASYSANGRLVTTPACPCGMVGYTDLGKLPSDPKALVRWAMRPPGGGGHYTTAYLAWNAFNGIEGTLTSYMLPPKVAAELYRALGDIPGVTVKKDAVDAAGRHDPAFVLTDKDYPQRGWTAEIFLNPRTFQLTGFAEHFPDKCQCPSPGTGETAILRQALVSGPGVRP